MHDGSGWLAYGCMIIDAVSDLSSLTTNLSAKIWQKLTLIQAEHRELERGHTALS